MRFHIGFSKRISWKWLLLIGGGLLAFFGVGNHVVLAAEGGTYNYSPTSVSVYNNNGSTTHNLTWSSTNSNALGGNGAYARFSSATCGGGLACPPIYSGEITYSYSAHKFCTSSDKVSLTTRFYVRNNNNDNPPNLGFNITGTQATINSKTYDSSNMVYVVSFTIADNSSFQLNYNFNDTNNAYYFYSSSTRISWTYNCDYTLEQSTSDIINNNNSNTTQIINNNNTNTQEIIDAVTIPQPFTSEDLPSFAIDNMLITSQTQKLFMLPIQLLNYVIQGLDTPNVCQPLTINLSSLNGLLHANVGSISIPCMGTRVKNYIGENWYNTFDYLMGAIVFYYIASNIVLRIQQIFSGVDTLPSYYTSHGKTKTLIVNNDTGEVIG